MNGKQITAVLDTITIENLTNGSLGDLWSKLPHYVAGKEWVEEIADTAERARDWFNTTDEISEDEIYDYAHQFADGQIETYYTHINTHVQRLSLWAYYELDDEVQQINEGKTNQRLVDLNSSYVYVAMRILFEAVAFYATEKALADAA